MWLICEYWKIHWRVSPLCNNRELYENLKTISTNKWVDFWLMVWITYAESHIWINRSPHQWCSASNNWSGKKREKYDDGTNSIKFWQQYHTLQPELKGKLSWCWLYAFDNVEHYWNSFANTLYYWYISKNCYTPECISRRYVGWWWWIKSSRVNRVRLFYRW